MAFATAAEESEVSRDDQRRSGRSWERGEAKSESPDDQPRVL